MFRSDLMKMKFSVDINVPHKKHMMCLNESVLNPFNAVSKKLWKKLENVPLNRYYSDITDELLDKLSSYIGHGVTKDQVLFGNGADEMLYFVFIAVRENPGDYALSLAPSYFDYESYSKAVNLGIKFIDFDKNFDFDPVDFVKQSQDSSCRLIILCNPNNPTGNLLNDEKIEFVLKNSDKPVILDETYFEFSKKTFAHRLKEYKNLIIIRSFSKAFSAAGLRFGYMISTKENTVNLKKVMTAFHSSLMIQAFVSVMLDEKDLFLEQVNKTIVLRDNLLKKLNSIKEVTTHKTDTNFIPFTIGKDTQKLFEFLSDNEVAIRSVGGHPLLKNYLRVTATNETEISLFLNLVKEFLQKKDVI